MIKREDIDREVRGFDEDLDFSDVLELDFRICRETHFGGISQRSRIVVMDVNGDEAEVRGRGTLDVRDDIGLEEGSEAVDPSAVLSRLDGELRGLFLEGGLRVRVNGELLDPGVADGGWDLVPLLEDDESF